MNKESVSYPTLKELCDTVLQDTPPCLYLVLDLTYSEWVSCTHSAPKGQQTNFCSDPKRPTHFPGLHGRVWWATEKQYSGIGTDHWNILRKHRIHTGTGGYGLYGLNDITWHNIPDIIFKTHHNLDYVRSNTRSFLYPLSTNVNIFLDDFPEIFTTLSQGINHHNLMRTLKGVDIQKQQIQISAVNKQLFHSFNQTKPITPSIEEDIYVENVFYI